MKPLFIFLAVCAYIALACFVAMHDVLGGE